LKRFKITFFGRRFLTLLKFRHRLFFRGVLFKVFDTLEKVCDPNVSVNSEQIQALFELLG